MKKSIFFCVLFLFMTDLMIDHVFSEELTKKPVIFVIFGPPGTGKGDFASRTSQTLLMPLITPAKLTLKYMNEDSLLGKKVQYAFLNTPRVDEHILPMLFDYIKKTPSENGFVIDGIISTVEQAKKIRETLKDQFTWVIFYINARDDLLKNRAIGRRICSRCGIIYHIEDSPPEVEKKCNLCNKPLIWREDDKPEQFQKRLNEFHKMMSPLKEYFEQEHIFYSFDAQALSGNPFLTAVYEAILKSIDEARHNELQKATP